MAASIGSLCSTAIKQISTISAFIDAVQQAPADVQALNNELASLYSALGHIRIAVRYRTRAPTRCRNRGRKDSEKLADECGKTLANIEVIVAKARVKKVAVSSTNMWTTVNFVFGKNQVASAWDNCGAKWDPSDLACRVDGVRRPGVRLMFYPI